MSISGSFCTMLLRRWYIEDLSIPPRCPAMIEVCCYPLIEALTDLCTPTFKHIFVGNRNYQNGI